MQKHVAGKNGAQVMDMTAEEIALRKADEAKWDAERQDRLIAGIKAEARRRIEATGLPWMVEREVSGGDPVPQTVKDQAAAIRAASDALEAMDPIPADYADDGHWQ